MLLSYLNVTNNKSVQLIEKIPKKKCEESLAHKKDKIKVQQFVSFLHLFNSLVHAESH